jgi:plastocyanin
MKTPARCQRIIVLGLFASMLTAGCAQTNPSAPPAPGRIHHVVIDDGVSDNDVRAQVGEEVRWVNVRQTPVSVVFNGLQHGEVSCEHGFSNSTNSHMTAVILPDDNASLCFSAVGRQTYRVLDASRPGIELNHEAAVRVINAQ